MQIDRTWLLNPQNALQTGQNKTIIYQIPDHEIC